MAIATEPAVALGERLEHRDPLGTDRQPVGGVLDVAAGDDGAVGGFERGADLEVRERRVAACLARHAAAAATEVLVIRYAQ